MTYKQAVTHLNNEPLEIRRKALTIWFAKNARNYPKLKHIFKLNPSIHTMQLRKHKTFKHHANTRRYLNSPIVYMKKLLNEHEHTAYWNIQLLTVYCEFYAAGDALSPCGYKRLLYPSHLINLLLFLLYRQTTGRHCNEETEIAQWANVFICWSDMRPCKHPHQP